jgi:hypothetical protein
MPMHDWTRVKSGTYHNFHLLWIAEISNRLNAGMLPPDFYAQAEQKVGGPEPDVITLSAGGLDQLPSRGGTTVAAPKASVIERAEKRRYARKTNRVIIHHDSGVVVAAIELVSPGNKDTKHALRSFARKSAAFILKGIHLQVIDPFPPGRYDPHGIHRSIWENVASTEFQPPPDKPLTVASYEAGSCPTAYVEPFAVNSALPDAPLFLTEEFYVNLPLEIMYQATWNVLPKQVRSQLE